nr:retrovirus-related Pol polyprotein from transposon TNT 1-94 [Tanacetum cinerariifolium]
MALPLFLLLKSDVAPAGLRPPTTITSPSPRQPPHPRHHITTSLVRSHHLHHHPPPTPPSSSAAMAAPHSQHYHGCHPYQQHRHRHHPHLYDATLAVTNTTKGAFDVLSHHKGAYGLTENNKGAFDIKMTQRAHKGALGLPATITVRLVLVKAPQGCVCLFLTPKGCVWLFIAAPKGTVRFGNDQFVPSLGYGDLVQGNITINRVYYVKGLNHNLFSVGQFCDADLEVAFWKSTCFVRVLKGNDLLTGNRGSDLYTISLQETTSLTLIYLMAKALPTQAWLWHSRLSHLNFDYINLLSKKDVVIGLPKLKYVKDQLCSSCEMSETSVANDTSGLVPQQQKASDYDSSSPSCTSSVNNSFSPTDNSKQQDIPPITNIQSSTEPSTPTNVNARKTTIIKQKIHSSNKMNLSILFVHRYEKLLSLPHEILII